MNRKSQGLSMQTIIIAALSLFVLIILILIITDKFSFFQENTGTCQSQGGICLSELNKNRCGSDYPIKIWTEGCTCIKTDSADSKDKTCEKKGGKGQCCMPIGR